MPSGTYRQTNVKCPFFQYDERNKITCEGIAPNSNIRMKYINTCDLDSHMERYCYKSYTECPIHKAVSEKYNEVGE